MPRPTTLTEAKTRAVCEVLRNGNTMSVAAAAVGVCKKTLYNWIAQGKKKGASKLHKDFALKVELARSFAAKMPENVIYEAVRNGDVKAAFQWLRIHRTDEWGDGPKHVIVEEVNEDERDKEMRMRMRELKAAYDAMEDEEDEQIPRV